MLNSLRTNLAWMLVALVLSSALWATVANQQSPDVSSLVGGVLVELRDKPQGLVATSVVPTVNVDVRAPVDLLPRLMPATFRAYIDASGAKPDVQEYAVRVESSDRRVRVENVTPAKVAIRFEPIEKKEVQVRLSVTDNPPFGYLAKAAKVTPEKVTVSGPEGLVDQVTSAVVELRLDNARSAVSQSVRPRPETAAGEPVDDVTTTPESVLVEVPIEQQLTYKAVPIAPQVAGSVALGYQIVGIMVDPTIVTVVGEPSVLEELPFLSTRSVDVSGATGDVVVSTDIVLPNTVSLVRRQTVSVRVYVSPVEANKVLRVVPQVIGADKARVDLDPSTVDVTVSGPMPFLSTLRPQDLQVSVDATGISGSRPVTVTASVPAPLRIDDIAPRQISVVVRPP